MQSERIRERVLEVARASRCGHVGSSLSCVELVAGALRYCEASNGVFILSKGHAGLALYAALSLRNPDIAPDLERYMADDSALCSHVCYEPAKGLMASSGSLGVGLGIAVGYALAYQIRRSDRKVVVLVGDGELDEGVVWESLRFVWHMDIRGFAVLVDRNGLRGYGPALSVGAEVFEGLGFAVRTVDGHDPAQIETALSGLADGRVCLLADTVKGKGLEHLEGTLQSHYWRAT